LVEFAMKFGLGGEIVVPIAPSYKVGVVAEAIGPDCIKKIIGPRQAEKMHEVIISEFEMPMTICKDKYYIITPENGRFKKEQYLEQFKGMTVSGLSEYFSGNNTDWLTVEDIRDQLSTL
jgi:UDP-N-acetylglucosamine 4,6-dehydratase